MKPVHMVAIGAGVLGVGYLFLRSRNANASSLSGNYLPAVQVQRTTADEEARQAALLRTTVGARAASGSSAGLQSVLTGAASAAGAKASQLAGGVVSGLVPVVGNLAGSLAQKATGKALSAAGSVGKKTVSTIKRLKFW
jgi:hypothetical protein